MGNPQMGFVADDGVVEERVERVRNILLKSADEMVLGEGLEKRIEHVEDELRSIQHELLLIRHVVAIDEHLEAELVKFDRALDAGVMPVETFDVEDLVEKLRADR